MYHIKRSREFFSNESKEASLQGRALFKTMVTLLSLKTLDLLSNGLFESLQPFTFVVQRRLMPQISCPCLKRTSQISHTRVKKWLNIRKELFIHPICSFIVSNYPAWPVTHFVQIKIATTDPFAFYNDI